MLSRAVLLHLLPAVTDSWSYHHHLPLEISQVSYKYTHQRWEGRGDKSPAPGCTGT